jgi:hypothetical protein
MPLSKHYKGSGEKVMREMKSRYGSEAGKRVFYATENKRKHSKRRKQMKKAMMGGGAQEHEKASKMAKMVYEHERANVTKAKRMEAAHKSMKAMSGGQMMAGGKHPS